MSHYNIVYTDLPPEEKNHKALQDIADWLGSKKKFLELTTAFKDAGKLTQTQFTFYFSTARVAGYPVVASWERCFGIPWVRKDEDQQEEYQRRSIINPDKENPL